MENWFKKRFKKLSKTPFDKEDTLKKNNEILVLEFLYRRLIEKYGENENYDYMIKFRDIINSKGRIL
jgi:hypothetical protein